MIKIRYILFYLKKKLFFFNNYPNGVIFPNKNYIEKLYNIKCKTIIENIELNYYFKKLINKKTKKIKITTNKLYFKKKYDFYFANFYLFHNKNFFYEKNKRRFNLKHNYIFNDKFFDFSNTKKLNIDNFSEKFSKIPRKIKLFKKPIINISTMVNSIPQSLVSHGFSFSVFNQLTTGYMIFSSKNRHHFFFIESKHL